MTRIPATPTPSNAELRPYGYAPGNYTSWCAACSKDHHNADKRSFKCRPCAVSQWAEVERICITSGEEQ